MKFFAAALALTWILFAPARGDCDGILTDSTVTQLDFFESVITANTLHQIGGELRYGSE
jgi:hypothetical protein